MTASKFPDRRTISLDDAVEQSRKIKKLEAENSRLRARIDVLSQAAEVIRLHDWTLGGKRDDQHDQETSIECATLIENFISRVNKKVAT